MYLHKIERISASVKKNTPFSRMPLLLFLFVCLNSINASGVFVNPSHDCAAGMQICYLELCPFNDWEGCSVFTPELYIDGLVPTTTDNVFFNFTQFTNLLIVPQNEVFVVQSIFLSNVELIVELNAAVQVASELEIDNCIVVVQPSANTTVGGNSYLKSIFSLSLSLSSFVPFFPSTFIFHLF